MWVGEDHNRLACLHAQPRVAAQPRSRAPTLTRLAQATCTPSISPAVLCCVWRLRSSTASLLSWLQLNLEGQLASDEYAYKPECGLRIQTGHLRLRCGHRLPVPQQTGLLRSSPVSHAWMETAIALLRLFHTSCCCHCCCCRPCQPTHGHTTHQQFNALCPLRLPAARSTCTPRMARTRRAWAPHGGRPLPPAEAPPHAPARLPALASQVGRHRGGRVEAEGSAT